MKDPVRNRRTLRSSDQRTGLGQGPDLSLSLTLHDKLLSKPGDRISLLYLVNPSGGSRLLVDLWLGQARFLWWFMQRYRSADETLVLQPGPGFSSSFPAESRRPARGTSLLLRV